MSKIDIGVASGAVVSSAYFPNSGNTDLNHLSVSGTFSCSSITALQTKTTNMSYSSNTTTFTGDLVISGKTEGIYLRTTSGTNGAITNNLANKSLPYGSYVSWNNTITEGETDFINSKLAGVGGFKFYSVSTNTENLGVLLMSIDQNGNVISNNMTTTNKTDITALQTKTTNFSYTGGLTVLQNPNNTTCTLSVGDNAFNGAGATYGMVNLTRTANDYSRPHLAFVKAGSCVWQVGYLNASNNLGFFMAIIALIQEQLQ